MTNPLGLVGSGMERPPDGPGLVRRDGVLRRLVSVPGTVSLVLLVAPAGYGKTTVLSQWAAQDSRTFAWAPVDDADNDPIRLLRRIVLALHRVEPVDDDLVHAALASRDVSVRGVVVPRLLNWLADHAGDRVLVLDDLHRLRSAASSAVIEALASGLPRGWHLAVASRHRLGMNLGLLRRDRRYLVLGPDDLSFGTAEASTVLRAAGSELPDEAVDSLVRRTEGWPAGVYLAALSLRDKLDRATAAARISGDDAPLADYFRDEVLDRQPADTVRFLLRTAVLARMSGPLCDAVLASTGSAVRLTEIENHNLFVVPQDRRGEWYRYHRLFAEMLLSELRRREPGKEFELHRRAAAWFAERGQPEEAISHALAGRDLATAARLVTMCAQPFVNDGRITTVRRWIEALGDDGLAAYPPVAVTAAWVWAVEGEAARARQCLLAAERASFSGAPADGSASLESGIVLIRAVMAPLGVDQMLLDAQRAVDLEPPGSPWHPVATWLLGNAHLLHGAVDAAVKAFERTAHLGRDGHRPATILALAQLSLLGADRDDWAAAAASAADAQKLMHAARLQGFMPCALAYAASAKVAVHEGDRQAALFNVGNALRLYGGGPTPVAFPWHAAQVALVLGRIFLELDDPTAARLKVDEARRHLARLHTEGALRDQLRQLAADVGRRGGPTGALSVMTLTEAELRVLRLLPTHLSLAEISRELDVSRNTVKSHVAAVYLKLHVATRADAVGRGRELGLLSS